MLSAIIILFLLVITTCGDILFEVSIDSNCTINETNERGKCVKLNNCQYARNLLKEKKSPQFCGFVHSPLVCCPLNLKLKLKPKKLSEEKCAFYYSEEPPTLEVDGGLKALSKEFPHMAAVGYGKENTNILWFCGGTLISHRFILSAAHCAHHSEYGPARWIRLGDLDLKNTTEDANPLDAKIIEIHVHPDYKSTSHYHDVALFKLEDYINFSIYFKPACLQTKEILPVRVLGATGWGRLGFAADTSSHLMKVDLSLIEYEVCAQRYKSIANSNKLKRGILNEYQICAGDAEGKDTCPGDSGGPLHYFVGRVNGTIEHFIVAGITSFGKGCGGENSAGVYTRVSAYAEWIESIAWKGDVDDGLAYIWKTQFNRSTMLQT